MIRLIALCTITFLIAGCQSLGSDRPMPQSGPDTDGDWVSDSDEAKYGSDPHKQDSDEDGVTDFEEIFIITSDPTQKESHGDDDGLPDSLEIMMESDPLAAEEDRDGDRIPDTIELQIGSDPGKVDTDGDLMSDFIEIYLTESEPAQADPINELGYPELLAPWLPQQYQAIACSVEVSATIDELDVVDAEEWDSNNDLIVGDEITVLYGLWPNALELTDLEFDFDSNSHSKRWGGSLIEDQYTNFAPVGSVALPCGDSVTFALQALEDDLPWGGVWNMGLWRDDAFLTFDRIPMGAKYIPTSMYFEGTTQDSDYLYDFDYTISLEMKGSS